MTEFYHLGSQHNEFLLGINQAKTMGYSEVCLMEPVASLRTAHMPS